MIFIVYIALEYSVVTARRFFSSRNEIRQAWSLHNGFRCKNVIHYRSLHFRDRGANVNERDQNGWIALHRVAFKGRMECVNLLVSHGVEVDVVDGSGFSVRPVEKMNNAVTVGWG
uniref:Uncharacterized protein n=1 Tax=Ipomoea trifida TaxID=35884 RepID=Q6JJ35_IPOTF|nr:hypothetical protein [Ipomoea trifida]BAF36335.1 hypothetical protein [Ipomoea trifida]